jgi:hyperosmotically inducible protein
MRPRQTLALVLAVSALSALVLMTRAEPRPDDALTRDANAALRAVRPTLQGSAILLEAREGRITLRGSVRSALESARVAKTVGEVPGVVEVSNHLEIVAPPASPTRRRVAPAASEASASGPNRTLPFTAIPAPTGLPVDVAQPDLVQTDRLLDDEEIRRNVQSALLDLDPQENAGVRVSVREGVVRLSGVVPSWQGNDARLHATRSVPGVRTIVNEVQVGTEVR